MLASKLFWKRLKPYRVRIALLFAVIGPGIITANVDNDAGGITTYSVAGARYGYSLLWMLPLVALALIIVQEMSSRLGVVTGKGLADLIRESLGVRLTALLMALLVFVNLANTVSEFAGVAASLEIFGVSKYISVPLAAVGVWVLVLKGNYKTTERVFLVASTIYLTYIASGVLAHPDWGEGGQALVTPNFQLSLGYVTIFVTIIGTTIAPWMQFYQQAAIADKGIPVENYRYEVIDVVVLAVEQLEAPPVLIGHSMGAIVVQRALRRAKARAMALLAPVPPQGLLGSSFMLAASNPEIFNEINKIQIFDGLAGSPDLLRQAIFSQRLPPAEVKRYLRRMRHESQRALFDLSWPQHFWIERTSIPVHVIGAADDLFFPPSLVEATAGLHGIDAEIVPDIAHALMLDANWEHTARGLAAWLERSLR